MKKYCPDCEAFFEMNKEKPRRSKDNLYGREIETE
jgi:hypothetical protein